VRRKKTIFFWCSKAGFCKKQFFCSPSFPSCLALEKDQTCCEMYQISVVEKKQTFCVLKQVFVINVFVLQIFYTCGL
jgi:hypothetical protein